MAACALFGINCPQKTKSTVKNTVNQGILNELDVKMIKQNITKNMMNVITKNAKSCSAAVNAAQVQSVENVDNSNCPINFAAQSQTVKVDLSCVQTSKIKNDLAQSIVTEIQDHIANSFDTQAMADFNAKAKAQSSSELLSGGSSSAEANVENTYNLSVTNKISNTMENIIINETNKNFKTDNIQAAILAVAAIQEQKVKNAKGCGINFAEQQQQIDSVMKAIQEDETINSSINNIANKLNSIATNKTATKIDSKMVGDVDTKAEGKGLGSLLDTLMGPMKWIIIAAVIGVVIIGVIFFMTGGQETLQAGIEQMGGSIDNYNYNSLIIKKNEGLISGFKSIQKSLLE